MCVAWGMVSACTGAVHSFAGLAVCRVVLGFTEAAFFPGVRALRMKVMSLADDSGHLFAFHLLREEADGTPNRHLVLWISSW